MKVQIFHHNDSDGLSSGAILTRAFERAGFEVHRFCLEKPYPALLQKFTNRKARSLSLPISPAGLRRCFRI